MAVEALKILLAIALITPLIHMTLPVEAVEEIRKHYYDEHYYDEYYYIDYIELATTSRRRPSHPEDLSRPIIGGVQIQVVPEFCSSDFIASDPRIIYCLYFARRKTCTAGYAMRVNNTVGFISAGHCADFNTGFHVYQPIYIPSVCYFSIWEFRWVCIRTRMLFAGVVKWVSREYDAMFVEFSNVSHLILHIEGGRPTYIGIGRLMNYHDVMRGLRVCKTGRTTGTTCGVVYHMGTCYYGGKTVHRCIYVEARGAPGDSGAPLYLREDIKIDSQVIPTATLLGHVIGGDEYRWILLASSITNILESGFTIYRE